MTAGANTSNPRRQRSVLVIVAAVAAAVDLLSKVAASAWLSRKGVDLPGPLDLQLGHNSGVAFGLGRSAPTWVTLALTSAVVVGIAVAAWRGLFASMAAIGLILGGAVANVADRVEGGSVVDMLHLGWWPTFNLADVWITTGAALLLLGEWRRGSARPMSAGRGHDATTSSVDDHGASDVQASPTL